MAATKNRDKRKARLMDRWDQVVKDMQWSINVAEISAAMSSGRWTYGSDEEKALLKAITDWHPEAVVRVCVDHMYDNFVRACTRFSISLEQRQEMWEYMTAMVRIRSDESFERKREQIRRYWVENRGRDEQHDGTRNRQLFGTKLLSYIDKLNTYHRIPFLTARRNHIYRLGLHFSNNNAESVNSAVKRAVHFRATAAPALVEKIHLMMKTQVKDAYRSLYGTGNYDLSTDVQDHFVGRTDWDNYTDNQRALAMFAALRTDRPYRPHQRGGRGGTAMTTSASGETSIISSMGERMIRKPSVKRKGHTRKRGGQGGRVPLAV